MGLVAVARVAAMTALAALWDAIYPLHLSAVADLTSHWAFKITAAAFELNLIKGHAEANGAILVGAATIVEVDIAEAFIIGFLANGLATRADGLAFQLFHFALALAPLIDAVAISTAVTTIRVAVAAIIVTISGRATVRCADRYAAMAVPDRDRRVGAFAFAMAIIGQSRGGKEQWRR